MDSASNSMTPRPQTVRTSTEYHSQASSLYHPGHGTPMRRHSSNPAELNSTQPLRRVEGTVRIHGGRSVPAQIVRKYFRKPPEFLDIQSLHLTGKC